MRRVFIILGLLLAFQTVSWAFLYEVKILNKEEIQALSDIELVNALIETKIEIDASRTFHGKAGFSPKEYAKYKELLGYIIKLRLEMQLRELEAPPIDDWLR